MIREGDIRFVLILQTQAPGFLETLRVDPLHHEIPPFSGSPEPFGEFPGFRERTAGEGDVDAWRSERTTRP